MAWILSGYSSIISISQEEDPNSNLTIVYPGLFISNCNIKFVFYVDDIILSGTEYT